MKFDEFQKNCNCRTYQDNKCVHPESKNFRQIGGCNYNSCPRKREFQTQKPLDDKKGQNGKETAKR
ncbi:MAG: hypothetical protein WC484_07060 [Candidatus Omnitrophota bacterium]|jgi:hypothetical protein